MRSCRRTRSAREGYVARVRRARLVEEDRPRVGGRAPALRLDDPRAEPLQAAPSAASAASLVGRSSRASTEGGRRSSADREALEPRLGHRLAGEHRPHQRDVLDRPRHRADGVERRARAGRRPRSRSTPSAASARPSRSTRRAAGSSSRCPCRARGRRARPRARPRCRRSSRRSCGRGGAGLRTVPYQGFWPVDAPGELGQVRLPDDRGAGVEQPRCTAAPSAPDVVGVDPRAVGRPDAGGVDQVLDEQRPPGERPVLAAAAAARRAT